MVFVGIGLHKTSSQIRTLSEGGGGETTAAWRGMTRSGLHPAG